MSRTKNFKIEYEKTFIEIYIKIRIIRNIKNILFQPSKQATRASRSLICISKWKNKDIYEVQIFYVGWKIWIIQFVDVKRRTDHWRDKKRVAATRTLILTIDFFLLFFFWNHRLVNVSIFWHISIFHKYPKI